MRVRTVLQSRKARDGTVTALVNKCEDWSPRSVDDVLKDLASERYRYVVPWSSGAAVVEPTVPGALDAPGPDGRPGGLRTLPDG